MKPLAPILFWPVLACTVGVILLQLKDQSVLRTDAAPYGIVSLEIGSYAKDNAIIASWKPLVPDIPADDFCEVKMQRQTRLQVAHSDVLWDYVLIVAYTALFVIVLATLGRETDTKAMGAGTKGRGAGTRVTGVMIVLALVAGLCDGVENAGLLHFIGGTGTPALARLTQAVAVTKAVILLALTLYILYVLIFKHGALQWLSGYIHTKTLQLFRYRIILLGVIFFSAPIWIMDQGQDLLINTNAEDIGVALFIGVVIVTALLNWWLAKLFFEKEYCPPFWPMKEPGLRDAGELASEKKVSRFLGVCTIIIPGVAILNALSAVRMHYWLDHFSPLAWLAGLLIIFFVLAKQNVAEEVYARLGQRWGPVAAKRLVVVLLLLLVFGLPAFFRFYFIPHNRESPQSLNFLFFDLVLIGLAFYIFVSVRTLAFDPKGLLGEGIGKLILPAATLVAFAFILYNIFPFTAQYATGCFLSLPVLLSGIVFYTLLITLIQRAGLLKRINFLLFIIIGWFFIVAAGSNNFHTVHRIAVPTPPAAPRLQDYFKQWVLQRQEEIRSAPGTYPVFLVNSYGGGIRAAAFTNFALSYMDDSLLRRDSMTGRPWRSFEHYVFSLSGASGGSIGSAIQCAWRSTHPDSLRDAGGHYSNPYADYRDRFENFYRHDFLTPVLSSIIGRDVWSSAVSDGWASMNGVLWPDRAAIQEELWARYARKDMGLSLDSEFNSIWDPARAGRTAYDVPLLFANTLNVDDGLKGIYAPVTLEVADFPQTIQVRELLHSMDASSRREESAARRGKDATRNAEEGPESISLITGAFLSARFPYISPSGKMGPGYHFIDGGLKDNSAASTSAGIFFALARYIATTLAAKQDAGYDSLLGKIRIYFVSISNTATSTLQLSSLNNRQVVHNPFEPLNPIVGIMNSAFNGSAMEADSVLRSRFAGNPVFAGLYGGYFSVWPNTFCINAGTDSAYCPLAPLGWQISLPSLRRLEAGFTPERLQENPEGILRILSVVPR